MSALQKNIMQCSLESGLELAQDGSTSQRGNEWVATIGWPGPPPGGASRAAASPCCRRARHRRASRQGAACRRLGHAPRRNATATSSSPVRPRASTAPWKPRPGRWPAGRDTPPTSFTILGVRDRRLSPAVAHREGLPDVQARPASPAIYHRTRDSIEAHLTIVFAAMAVCHCRTPKPVGVSRNSSITRRYRTVTIKAGGHTLTAADPATRLAKLITKFHGPFAH